jgi:anti-sigma regulatory factor (Ser/Thr protein kinase)
MNLMVPIQAVRLRESRLRMPRLPEPRLPEPGLPRVRRVRLNATPAAAAAARRRVRAVIRAWDLAVDPDIAVLLTSELVTNAIAHERSGTVTLHVSSAGGQLRVEVLDTCPHLPVLANAAAEAPADAETGRGLMLVATLAASWGCDRAPAGKAVWFELDPAALDAVSVR